MNYGAIGSKLEQFREQNCSSLAELDVRESVHLAWSDGMPDGVRAYLCRILPHAVNRACLDTHYLHRCVHSILTDPERPGSRNPDLTSCTATVGG